MLYTDNSGSSLEKDLFKEQTTHGPLVSRGSHPWLFNARDAAREILRTNYNSFEDLQDHRFHIRMIEEAKLRECRNPITTVQMIKIMEVLTDALEHYQDATIRLTSPEV